MKKFEVGKIYGEKAVKYEVVNRTAKTLTFVSIAHYGRYNERRSEEKKAKIHDWDGREVFYVSDYTIEA